MLKNDLPQYFGSRQFSPIYSGSFGRRFSAGGKIII